MGASILSFAGKVRYAKERYPKVIDVERCLKRIGYSGPTEPTLYTLRALQMAFLRKVPFENLDIHLGRQIRLSSESIYDKIVLRRRGGFCYECNILFFDLLKGLNFQVEYLSARMVKGSAVGPEYDHMVLLVTLEHDYLADVGNGQSCREPLRIDGANRATSEGYAYRVGPPAKTTHCTTRSWMQRGRHGFCSRSRLEIGRSFWTCVITTRHLRILFSHSSAW